MIKLDKTEFLAKIAALKDNARAVLVVAVVVFVLDAGFILRWQIQGLGKTFSKARQMKTDIVRAREDTKFRTTNKEKIESLKAEFEAMNKRVIDSGQLPSVLETISSYADMSSLRILKIKPVLDEEPAKKPSGKSKAAQPQVKDSYNHARVTLALVGGFNQLGRFVALLENADIFFSILKVEIVSNQEEFGRESVSMLLEVLLRKA